MQRSIRLADILGAIAGIVFAVLIFLSVSSVDPQVGVSDQELQTWWADSGNRDAYVFSMYALLVAGPLFLLFISRLRLRLRAADAANWTDTVLACGVVVATALGITAVLRGVISSSVRFDDEPLPGVDTLRFQTDLAVAAWDVVILFAVVLVAIVSILALATRVLPRWIGVLGAIVTVGGVALFVAGSTPLALPLLNIWVLANSVHLARTPATAPIGGPTRQLEVSSAQA